MASTKTTTTVELVPLDAAPHEVAALREVLLRLAGDTPEVFAALFDPLAARGSVAPPPPEITYVLRLFGLVSGEHRLGGRARIRRHAGRFYLLDAGRPTEYRQDVWPETDALLAELATAAPGHLLDMGTGSGIVAIEAAARGHTVVATDVYASALRLARFNARLAGLAERVELVKGHLFEPVRDRVFDLTLTAPHYTRVADQLRLEALRAVPAVIAPGGRAVVATFLEWEGDGPLAAAEMLLGAQAASGLDITVTPIASPVKRAWFTVAAPDEDDGALPGLVSRHRFLVTYRHAGTMKGRLLIERPLTEATVLQRYVSLGRLDPARPARRPARGALAVIRDEIDLEALEALILAVRDGVVTLDGAVPAGLLDACRFGGVPCVSDRVIDGAAGAILDRGGGVRPCAHGRPVGTVDDTMAELVVRYRLEAVRAAERRGCATCPAEPRCSRCLFPHVVDEARYCDLIRAWVDELPGLHRLLAILAELGDRPTPVRIKLRRAAPLVAATGRPPPSPSRGDGLEDEVRSLALRWGKARAALVVDGLGRCTIFCSDGARPRNRPVAAAVAAVAELVGDGMTAAELRGYAALEGIAAGGVEAALGTLDTMLPRLD